MVAVQQNIVLSLFKNWVYFFNFQVVRIYIPVANNGLIIDIRDLILDISI